MKTSEGKLDKKSLAALSGLLFITLGMVAVPAASQIQLYNGAQVKLNGGDIVDSGTTVWDSSNGYVPKTAMEALSKSDVGLGNVENIALSSATWTDIGISQSDVSASDVGLGNADNADELDLDGSESLTGSLNLNGNNILSSEDSVVFKGASIIQNDESKSPTDYSNEFLIRANSGTSTGLHLESTGTSYLTSDTDGDSGGPFDCYVSIPDNGDFICDGSKSWAHDLENGTEAIYTSQESPEVRAVYEGKASVDDQTRIDLPSHWTKTVSDTEPKLRATATVQGKLAYAAVIEKTDDYIVLDSSEPASVNYRITGIREGYEDKQVVRPKEE